MELGFLFLYEKDDSSFKGGGVGPVLHPLRAAGGKPRVQSGGTQERPATPPPPPVQ